MRPRQKLEEEERDYVRVSRGRVWRRRRRSNIFCPHLGAFATVYYGRNIVEAERGDTDDWQKRSISFFDGSKGIISDIEREKGKRGEKKKVITESKADSQIIIIMGKKTKTRRGERKKINLGRSRRRGFNDPPSSRGRSIFWGKTDN